jgi:hypothetical protein
MEWNLKNTIHYSIHLLNEFCADSDAFSFRGLAFLKLKGLDLRMNTEQQELTMIVCTDQDYQILQTYLIPEQRLYQLLGMHFKKVHIVLNLSDEPVRSITILLISFCKFTDLRQLESVGARLRRALNIALQEHTAVLWLYNNDEVEHFKKLWKRARVSQLLEKHKIIHNYDVERQLIKLWKRHSSDEGGNIVVTIE